MRFYLIFAIFLFLLSCKSDKKEVVVLDSRYLTRHQMISIIKDIHLVDATLSVLQPRTSNNDKYFAAYYYNDIFQKHKITKAFFEENVIYYSLHPQVFEEVYDSVQIEISKLQVTQEIFDEY